MNIIYADGKKLMIPQTKFLYKITNLINNKVYIGQTIHPDKRWWEHKQRAKTHYDNYPIHLAIAKYGEENFVFEILEESQNYNEREKELIKQYNSLFPNGYNIMPGGASPVYYGEDHPRNTISNINVLNIINELQIGKLSDKEIAKKYDTTDKIVADINHGYTHIQPGIKYPIREKRGSQKLTKEQVKEIKNLLKTTNLSYSDIGNQFGVSKSNIYHINTGRTFKDDNEKYPIRTAEAV